MKRVKFAFILVFFSFYFLHSQTWEKLNGPYGSGVYDGVIDHQGNVFLLSSSGEIYLSMDGGDTWIKTDIDLVFDPNTFGYFKVAPWNEVFLAYADKFYSFDFANGKWTLKSQSLQFHDFSFGENGSIYGLEYGAVYFSKDTGVTFELGSKTNGYSFQIVTTNLGYHFIVSGSPNFNSSLIYRIDQGGKNLSLVSVQKSYDEMLFDDASRNLIFLDQFDLYVSTDFAQSWQKQVYPFPPKTRWFPKLLALANGDLLGIGDYDNILRSRNGGIHWELDSTYLPVENGDSNIQGISVSDLGNILFIYSYHAFIEFPNGKRKNLLLPVQKANSGEIYQFAKNKILTNTIDGYQLSMDDGQSWQSFNLPDPAQVYNTNFRFHPDGSIIGFNPYFTSHISYDCGQSWQPLTFPTTNQTLNSFALSPEGDFVFLTQDTTFVSVDKGLHWNSGSNGGKGIFFNSNDVFCGYNKSICGIYLDDIIISKDQGFHWQKLSIKYNGLGSNQFTVSKNNNLYYLREDDGSNGRFTLYIFNNFSLYPSADNYFKLNNILPNETVVDENETIYVSSSENKIFKKEFGKNWELMPLDGVDFNTYIIKLHIGSDKKLYASTADHPLYRTRNSITAVTNLKKKSAEIKYQFIDEQLEFDLSGIDLSGNEVLKLFTMDGKLLNQISVHNSIERLNIGGYPSEIYLVQLSKPQGLSRMLKVSRF